ncbi:tetratricopeptide repeat protein, partial [Myxococcus sp. CA039A]|uniref:tetratricopeptide repeat protein n=1 Tax=Myxococcus sp. CA039A TaxID=2741737 RepID=UPI001C2D2CF7
APHTPHMPPSLLNKGLVTALSVTSGLAWAGPKLAGPYMGDTYGQVDLHMVGERLVGTSAGSGGGCKFPAGTEVLTGEFQGNVLVATVQVCLSGVPECVGARSFPVLAVYNPQSSVITARFRLPEGCHSPGLKDSQLLLRGLGGAPVEEGEEEGAASGAQGSAPDAATDEPEEAVAAAPKSPEAKVAEARPSVVATSPVSMGLQLLAVGKWEVARSRFEAALLEDARNLDALVGMAGCHLGTGNSSKALESLNRISSVPAGRPDVYAWQAYAHDMAGNKSRVPYLLRRALDLGWKPEEPKPWEAALVKALAGDIEQARQAKNRKRAPGRESAGAGSTSP